MVLNNTGKSNQMLFLLWDFLHQSLPLLSFFMMGNSRAGGTLGNAVGLTLELQNASKSLKSSICEGRRSSGASVSGFLCLNQGFCEAGENVSRLKATLFHIGRGTAGSVLGHVNTTTLHRQSWAHWRSFIISSISPANPRSNGGNLPSLHTGPSSYIPERLLRILHMATSNMNGSFFVSCFKMV